MAFFIMLIFGYMAIGFMSTQTAPDPINNTIAHNLYENQSAVIELSYTGYNGALLLLILAIVLSAAWLIIKAIT